VLLARVPAVEHDADVVVEPVLRHHGTRDPRGLLYVRRRAARHVVLAEDKLLGDPPAHAHVHRRDHLAVAHGRLVALRQRHHHPEGLSPRHDRRLVDPLRSLGQDAHERVPGLVVRRAARSLGRDHGRLPLGAHEYLVLGPLEDAHGYRVEAVHADVLVEPARPEQRRVEGLGEVRCPDYDDAWRRSG
ncbi:hypothetical protein THAOC_30090, partial [Thalassiosira oceanica]